MAKSGAKIILAYVAYLYWLTGITRIQFCDTWVTKLKAFWINTDLAAKPQPSWSYIDIAITNKSDAYISECLLSQDIYMIFSLRTLVSRSSYR